MSGEPTLTLLNGVHAAGKTTVGEAVSGPDRPFHGETPARLIAAGHDPTDLDTFQRAVFAHERARDDALAETGTDALVEGWHVANATCSRNWPDSDRVAAAQECHLADAVDRFDVRAVFLDLDPGLVPPARTGSSPGATTPRGSARRPGARSPSSTATWPRTPARCTTTTA